MRIFASDRLASIMSRLGMKEGEAIISPMVTRAIERAQRRVEEQNFSSRKHVLEYDDVMNQQRQVIYKKRRKVLEGAIKLDFFEHAVKGVAETLTAKFSPETSEHKSWQMDNIAEQAHNEFHVPIDTAELKNLKEPSLEAIVDCISEQVLKDYEAKKQIIGDELVPRLESYVYLQVMDHSWKEHLKSMDYLQDSVRLRGYGQRDPLQEYKKEAFNLFEALMYRIEDETTLGLVRMPPPEVRMEAAAVPEFDEPDESKMNFTHPEASSPVSDKGPRNEGPTQDEDGLIYHGSRDQGPDQSKVETFKRDGDKVGRNDLCPCGSGKKYKKCHGNAATVSTQV
jgi:preprotein translocase subunit SecA